jgi:hypothetical protein
MWMFAEVDWSQHFVLGLMGGGGLIIAIVLFTFIRAMFASKEEAKEFESQQGLYLGCLILGIAMLIGGIYMRKADINGVDSNELANYKEFVPSEGTFRVKFPTSKPKKQTQRMAGMSIVTYSYEEKDGMMAVAYLDFPSSVNLTGNNLNTSFNSGRNAMLQALDAKLVKEDKITLQGKYPGREIRAEVPAKAAEMYTSMYLVEKRLYQVLIMGREDWLKSDKARKFLNSFALK